MPYQSQKQERFFEAVRAGWQPDHIKAPPKKVVDEFHDASVGAHGKIKPKLKHKLLAKALKDSP
jgi:hypothetical protein